MYLASDAFHEAVANGNDQMALLIFPDAIFTNDDIDVDAGVELDDYFNTEEEISIGQALSNELRFNLFNDKRLLNDYEFGEFKATLGVMISAEDVTMSGNCMIQDGSDIYVGRNSSPYLRKNGSAMANAPTWAVKGMLSLNGKLYCFGENNNVKVFNESTGAVIQETVNAFMLDKAKRNFWMCGTRYDSEEQTLTIWKNGKAYLYEFVPLGTFIADRPNAPDVIEISFTCHDAMTRFSEDMPDDEELGITYPVTFKGLLTAVCNKANVPYGGENFINCDATLDKRPDEFDNCTMRDVVGWIAEAAASNARINRDGYLVMDWLKTTSQSYSETDYVDFEPYWYEVDAIDKLYNRSTSDNTEKTAGDGDIGYLIQDNPLLRGVE